MQTAPDSYFDTANPDLKDCAVCQLPFDPTPKGFYTEGCAGCDPALCESSEPAVHS